MDNEKILHEMTSEAPKQTTIIMTFIIRTDSIGNHIKNELAITELFEGLLKLLPDYVESHIDREYIMNDKKTIYHNGKELK